MSIFGILYYETDGSSAQRLMRFISVNKLPVYDIVQDNDALRFKLPYEYKKILEKFLDEKSIAYTVLCEKGPPVLIKQVIKKQGLIAGTFVSLIVLFFVSHIIFSFEILTDNKQLKTEIMDVLYQNNIRAGSNLNDIDMTVAERELKRKVDSLAWAGISVQGCKVVIDVLEKTPIPESTQKRLPSDLISKEDAVIEKVELKDGNLLKPVGSGVAKGETIVTGNIIKERTYYKRGVERHEVYRRFARSVGRIYGSFERNETFFHPYTVTEKRLKAPPEEKSFLTIFDAEIPLFFDSDENSIISPYKKENLTLFGAELPVGIRSAELTSYDYITKPISAEEAAGLAHMLAEKYEHNFLSEYDMKSREESVEYKPDGVYLTVNYSLYGEISEEVEFFIRK